MTVTIETEKLQLVIGVPKGIGDTDSAEQGIRVFPLVLSGYTGFSINPANPWQPARPALKDQWNESRLQDGRSLAGVAVENVTETIELKAVASDRLELEGRINELSRFINQARSFFATFYQIEPVYLEWAAMGGKGSQYALVYNIDMNVVYNYPGTGTDARANVTLVIEREPAWRGVPPGVSPRAWTKYTQGLLPGAGYTYTDLSLLTTGALVQGTVYNRNEYDLSVDDGDYPSLTQNWLDIPAEKIPGDAPALTCIRLNAVNGTYRYTHVYLSRITKPGTLTARTSGIRGRPLTINATDSLLSILTRVTDTAHGVKNASTGTQEVVELAFPTGALSQMPWQNSYRLDVNSMRGKYNIFYRGYFMDDAPPDDGVRLDLSYAMRDVETVLPRVVAGGASVVAGDELLIYGGQIVIPDHRAYVGAAGSGLRVLDNAAMNNEDLDFRLGVAVTSGETFRLIDMVLMPFDEPACVLVPITERDDLSTTRSLLVDNTSYFAHGRAQAIAGEYTTSSGVLNAPLFIQGSDLVLEPGIDNRLAILIGDMTGGDDESQAQFTVYVDIVPRWYGVRDS